MKTKFIEKEFKYDGNQIKPLVNYMNHGLLGDSCVAWIGACNIPFAHMMDGEDLLQRAEIKGSRMLHFIFEIFDRELATGVFLQRLFAAEVQSRVAAAKGKLLIRKGDDLYLEDRKLSISIATKATNSVLVHFAMNISNEGTPVKTCALEDLGLEPKAFANELLQWVSDEYQDIVIATRKVRTF